MASEYPPIRMRLEEADQWVLDAIEAYFPAELEKDEQILMDEKTTKVRTRLRNVGAMVLTFNIDYQDVVLIQLRTFYSSFADWVKFEDVPEYLRNAASMSGQ
jgi:hypothetical protein